MSYMVRVFGQDDSISTKSFADHKSARGYARRSVKKGDNVKVVTIHLRDDSDNESTEILDADTLSNVYTPMKEGDNITHHLVPQDEWADTVSFRVAKEKKAKKGKSATA